MARPWVLPLAGVAALIMSTACAMFTLLLAIALSLKGSHISPLALTAGILDVLGIGWVAYLFASVTGGVNSTNTSTNAKRRTAIPTITLLPTMLLSSSAASLTFATAIWIHIQPAETAGTIFGHVLQVLNTVDFVLWGATIVAQSAFVALCFHETEHDDHELPAGNRVSIIRDLMDAFNHPQEPPRDVPPPMQMQNLPAVPPPPSMARYARSLNSSQSNSTAFSADGKFSVRSTIHGGIRSVTSRSRLIRQKSWAGPASSAAVATNHKALASHHGSLHEHYAPSSSRQSSISLDTSAVEEIDDLGYALRSTTPPPKTRLETIPGSRANSPARALDGPFPEHDEIDEHDDDDVGVLTEMCVSRRGSTASSDTSASIDSQVLEKDEGLQEHPAHLPSANATASSTSSPPTEVSPTSANISQPQPKSQIKLPRLRTSSFSHPHSKPYNHQSHRRSISHNPALAIPSPPISAVSPSSATASPTSPVSPFDQSFIHPLFRTDSPMPPPSATLGTTVTAAAMGRQFVTPAEVAAARAAGSSRPTSPTFGGNAMLGTRSASASSAVPVGQELGLGLQRSRGQSFTAEEQPSGQQRRSQPQQVEQQQSREEQPRKTFETPRPAPPPPNSSSPLGASTTWSTPMSSITPTSSPRSPTRTALALAPVGAQIIIEPPTPQREPLSAKKGDGRVALGEVSGNMSPRGASLRNKDKGKEKAIGPIGVGNGAGDRETWWV